MSYILEALKKSQQERDLGLAPAAQTDTPLVAGAKSGAGRHAWGYFSLAMAAAAILISLYGLMQGRFSDPSGTSVPVPVEASVAPTGVDRPLSVPDLQPASVPSSEVDAGAGAQRVPGTALVEAGSKSPVRVDREPEPEPASEPGPLESAPGQAVTSRADPGAGVPVPPVVAFGGADAAVESAGAAPRPAAPGRASGSGPGLQRKPEPARPEVAASPPPPADSRRVKPSATEGRTPAVTEAPAERGTEERVAAAARKSAVSPAPVPATDSSPGRAPVSPPRELPPGPSQLPPGVFKALPETRLLVHVYAEPPAQRFVILNARKLREGETSPEGLRLEEILPEGVVLRFKGHRFFIPR